MARKRARSRSAQRQHTIGKALVPSTVSAGANRGTVPTATPFPLMDVLNSAMSTSPFPVRALPRDPYDRLPFGPLEPLTPDPISPVIDETGQPEAWVMQYPVGWNIPGQDYREIPWSILYDASTGVDIIRRCIEVRKGDIASLKWAWQVRPEVISEAYSSDTTTGKADVEKALREQWAPEIDRLNAFWVKPWKTGEYTFTQWIKMLLDQVLVLDALAIYPRCNFGGDLLDLEIIDGATIKPLLDYRGSRPAPPNPAFQQILYGFPRGEWTAATTIDQNGQEVIQDGYLAGQLYYRRNNPRAQSPYGLSAVEQALTSARTYLARQGWMISEYADGATPTMWLQPQAGPEGEVGGLNLRQRREWQNALNDELSGQTRARHRIKIGVPGHVPTQLQSADERYKPDYDLHLIKLVAMHFGVPITKLGFTEAHGLGSSGHSQAQLGNATAVAQDPDVQMLTEIINELASQFLRAPAELTFAFVDPDDENAKESDGIADAQLKRGSLTYNEDRRRLGLPTYDFDGADEPIIITATGPTFVADALTAQRATSAATIAQASATVADPTGQIAAQQAADAQGQAPPDDGTATPQPSGGAADDTGGDTTKGAAPDHEIAQAVLDQLAPDYSPESLAWVHGAHWRGPVLVPLSKVDFDDAESWDATTGDADADKVDRFSSYIKQGRMKPVVMVQVPGENKYRVIDGHHRSLAYQGMGRPVLAYVGKVGAQVGPWTSMHNAQHSTDDPMSVSAPPAMKAAEIDESLDLALTERARERLAHKRFTAKAPTRDFEWIWHTPAEAELIKFGTFVESQHPRGRGGQFGAGTPGPTKHGVAPRPFGEAAPKRGAPPKRLANAGHAGTWHAGHNSSHAAPAAGESAAQFNADNRSTASAAAHAAKLMATAKDHLAKLKDSEAHRAAHAKLASALHHSRAALTKARKAAEAHAHAHHLTGARRKAYIAHATAKEQAAYNKAKAASSGASAASASAAAKHRAAALAAAEAAVKGKALEPDVTKVGPKGYIHGWIFVGVPGVGARVFHPHHGHGTITSHDGGHVGVKFDKGHEASFQARHDPSATGDFHEHTHIPDVATQNANRTQDTIARVGRGAREREPVTDPLDKARMKAFRADASKRTYSTTEVTRRDVMLKEAQAAHARESGHVAAAEAEAKANFDAQYRKTKRNLKRRFPGEDEHINDVLAGTASWSNRDDKLESARAALTGASGGGDLGMTISMHKYRRQAAQDRIDQLNAGGDLPGAFSEAELAEAKPMHKLTAHVDPERPLAVYGDLLTMHDNNEMTHHHMLDLQQIDPHVHGVVAKHLAEDFEHEHGKDGAGIYVGSHDVTKLDDLKTLDFGASNRPDVGDMRTAEQVGGVFQGHSGKTGIGHAEDWYMKDGLHGNHSTARHEVGHAYDNATANGGAGEMGRASQTEEFQKIYQSFRDDQDKLTNKASDYFLGGDHFRGRKETFAEAFSIYHSVTPQRSSGEHETPEEMSRRRSYRMERDIGMTNSTADAMVAYLDGLTARAKAGNA